MSGFVVLLGQAIIYFAAMAAIFHYRAAIGIGVFYSVLGVMHFLETYLAAVFFIELPFGLISPGSTMMFAGKLAFFLLLYIKEDAESMRQPVYGLLLGNILMVALTVILRAYSGTANLPGNNADLPFLDQIGFLMVWGTLLLFVDLIAMVIIYERIGRDALTGMKDRGQFDTKGPAMLKAASRSKVSVSLMMIDMGVRIKTWTGFTSQSQDCFDIRLGFERQAIS
ncbi:hypothetical protein [Ochrobactrum soli]|uniref:hypothetical protein n=1 Tax=Ochrobactrum soli TaxID=2448455 RepID=UPI001AECED67|nr:hypothetical protein [[Ochrobactrum] soli]